MKVTLWLIFLFSLHINPINLFMLNVGHLGSDKCYTTHKSDEVKSEFEIVKYPNTLSVGK